MAEGVEGGSVEIPAAIQSAIRLLDGHKEEVFVNRRIALPTRTYHRRQQAGPGRVGDVIDADAIEVSQKQVFALERKIGVSES